MSTDYTDIIAAAEMPPPDRPYRTRRGALKFQPANSDWSLDRLEELKEFYRQEYNRSLPVSVVGQGSIHNKWGLEHRNSADIGLDPTTNEGRTLLSELESRGIPYLAFDKAIPGAATGPHIHIGRPSHRTSTKYPVGSRVNRAKSALATPTVDYTDIIAAAEPSPVEKALLDLSESVTSSTVALQQPQSGMGDLRRAEAAEQRTAKDTGVGRLRQLDEPEVARVQQIQREVQAKRAEKAGRRVSGSEAQLLAQAAQPSFAEDFQAALQADDAARSRYRELVGSLTDSDKQQLAALTQQLRGRGPTARGVDIGVQRVAGGLMYKLAGLLDIAGGPGTSSNPNVLSDYLRRQASIGELAIGQVEAELPPPMRQQLADFIVSAVGALPEIYGAVGIGGPVGGFAALGGLEATGQKRTLVDIARETAKGAVLGKVLTGAVSLERPAASSLANRMLGTGQAALGIGAGTLAVEKAFGADDLDAARSAVTNVLFHGASRFAGEAGRLAQLAERTVKPPPAIEPSSTTDLPPAEAAQVATATEAALKTPLAPSLPFAERRGPERVQEADWLAMTPEERAAIRTTLATEMEGPPAEPAVSQPTLPFAEPIQRTALADLMARRQVEGPESPAAVELTKLAEAIEASQVPFEGPPAFGEGIPPRTATIRPSGDPTLDAARQAGLDYNIEVVQTPEGFTIQKHSGQHIADVRTPAEAEAAVRAAITNQPLPPATEPVTKPPVEIRGADIRQAPSTPATTEAVPAATEAASPARYQVVRGRDGYVLEDTQTAGVAGNKVVKAGRDKSALEAEAAQLNALPARRAQLSALVERTKSRLESFLKTAASRGISKADALADAVEAVRPDVEKAVGRASSTVGEVLDSAIRKLGIPDLATAEELRLARSLGKPQQVAAPQPVQPTNVEIVKEGLRYTARFDTPSGHIVTEGFRSRQEAQQYVDNYGRRSKATLNRLMAEEGPINLITGKPIKPSKKGEAGYVNTSEIAAGIRRVRDELTGKKERSLTYILDLPGTGRALAIDFTIDRKGIAHPTIGPYEKGDAIPDVSGADPLHIGVDTILALKRFLMQTHPEIRRVQFKRAGSTGGKVGRSVKLPLVQRTTPERPTGYTFREAKPVDFDAVKQSLAQRGLEVRELTEPIPGFSVMRGGREVAKFANRDRATALESLANYTERFGGGEGGFFRLFGRPKPKQPKPTPEEKATELRAQLDREEAQAHEEFQAQITAEQAAEPFLSQPHTPNEAGKRYGQLANRMLYLNSRISDAQRLGLSKTEVDALWKQHASTLREAMDTERYIKDLGYKVNYIGEVAKVNEPFPSSKPGRKGEGGYIDLNELRAGLAAGRIKLEEALDRLHGEFPGESELSLRARLAPQPRSEEGKFAEGSPGSPKAEQQMLKSEAIKYREQYKALDFHKARKEGLDIVNDDVATDYFTRLRRLAATHLPAQAAAVDRAENLFHQGKYGQSAMLAESVFRGLPDRVNQYTSARAASQLVEQGIEPRSTEWRNVIAEVKRRLKETGGLSGGGSTFYDVTKYPQGGLPDHAKIAYIVEPVIEALKADTARLISEGRLKAEDYLAHIRTEVSKLVAGSDFSDWHPVNRSAAMGVLIDRLREEGPPSKGYEDLEFPNVEITDAQYKRLQANQALREMAGERSIDKARLISRDPAKGELWEVTLKGEQGTTAPFKFRVPLEGEPPSSPLPAEPPAKRRSLPKTLERSGRDPGTNLTYQPIGNVPTEHAIADRIAREGVEAVESWYRTADPSAERTAAFIQLVDHHMAESARLVDTAPAAAQAARARAIELTNLEADRATTIGQAEQMYSRLNKYTPAGVAREVATMQRRGVEVPAPAIEALTHQSTEYQRADRDVHRLERKVAEEEAKEAAPPAGTGSGGGKSGSQPTTSGEGGESTARPRRYRPRTRQPQPNEPPSEHTRRQLDEAARRRRAAARAIARQMQALEQQRTLAGYWKRSMNITRGLMVSAFSTAMRNLQTQLVRFDVERLTDVVEHSLRRSTGLTSDLSYRNIWRNALRQFQLTSTEISRRTGGDTGEVAEAREILSHHAEQYARMFNNYAGGVEVPIHGTARNAVERLFSTVERGVEIANFANRVQEFHVRSAEFLAEVDLHLRREHNQTLEQYVSRHGIDAIPQTIVERGVSKALEVTFADMPSRDSAGGRLLTSLIEFGNYIPPTISPVSFPRFMFNNLKFLYQYNPTGLVDVVRGAARNRSVVREMARVEADTTLTAQQRAHRLEQLTDRRANIARAVSRTIVGSSMLLLAYQFRKSDHAGEKWYELKFGGHTLDARPFGPFSTYLFLAEVLRRKINGEKAFTVEELAGALGATTGPGGTAIAVAERLYDHIANGDWDKVQRILKTEAGEWGKALLTPIRQLKDLVAAFDSEEGINRDTGTEPFLGQIKESIPFAGRDLPPATKPTTATPIHQERPLIKAITGWRVVTPKTYLERQLDELNFANQEIRQTTGIPEIDQYEKAAMGPLMDELSADLEKDTEWKSLSKAARSKYLRDLLIDIRQEVREMGRAEHPEWYDKLDEQNTPRREREFNKELNSPGLSKALQLGVPMTIPPIQPGEDDIAYRARLLQLGRERRERLDRAIAPDFSSLNQTSQRNRLREALYLT